MFQGIPYHLPALILSPFEIAPVNCATPVIGTITIETVTGTPIVLYDTNDWQFVMIGSPAIPEDSEAVLLSNQVSLNFKVRNYSELDPTVEYSDILIGNVGIGGRPTSIVSFTPENTSSLIEGQYVTIDQYGAIRYTGGVTDYSMGVYTEIRLTNLAYNI